MRVTERVLVPEDLRAAQPALLDETVALFDHVSRHDFDSLAALCDDDFGIVDLDTDGGSRDIATRPEWEAWFRELFGKLTSICAETRTEIESYDVLERADMAMSVVRFGQILEQGGRALRFRCVVTIVWKRVDEEWREARWHVSLLDGPVPVGS